ncbi:MAG: hypothetical protein M1834_000942 [Cirrosporium novae-zelandiae]|nr:MAG: hypothetical protein M1834_000942 [Cirrosporium novae-zelandiae]
MPITSPTAVLPIGGRFQTTSQRSSEDSHLESDSSCRTIDYNRRRSKSSKERKGYNRSKKDFASMSQAIEFLKAENEKLKKILLDKLLDMTPVGPTKQCVCPVIDCKKAYPRNDHLNRHIRQSKEATHKTLAIIIDETYCVKCDKAFNRPTDLIRHEKSHGGNYISRLDKFINQASTISPSPFPCNVVLDKASSCSESDKEDDNEEENDDEHKRKRRRLEVQEFAEDTSTCQYFLQHKPSAAGIECPNPKSSDMFPVSTVRSESCLATTVQEISNQRSGSDQAFCEDYDSSNLTTASVTQNRLEIVQPPLSIQLNCDVSYPSNYITPTGDNRVTEALNSVDWTFPAGPNANGNGDVTEALNSVDWTFPAGPNANGNGDNGDVTEALNSVGWTFSAGPNANGNGDVTEALNSVDWTFPAGPNANGNGNVTEALNSVDWTFPAGSNANRNGNATQNWDGICEPKEDEFLKKFWN